jgi:hypothetical protein
MLQYPVALQQRNSWAVLAGAHAAIFKIYFFKFYLALVVLEALHGLVFLPVVLSVVGPEAFHHWRLRWKAADDLLPSRQGRLNFWSNISFSCLLKLCFHFITHFCTTVSMYHISYKYAIKVS